MVPTETWGISGSTFLVVYLLLTVVAAVAAISMRRTLRTGRTVAGDDLQSRPEDIAYLNGGPELAVYAALSAMHVTGSIATSGPSSRGVVHAVGPARQGSALQNAIHSAAVRPVVRRSLPFEPGVASALGRIRDRLERAGLMLTDEQRRAYRCPAFLLPAVLALGLVRVVAGVANGRPVALLLLVMAVVGVMTLVLFVRVPTRTEAGDDALAVQRARHTALAPPMRPDWGAVGAGGAALSVGVFGVGALMAAQPAFAEDLEAQQTFATGGGGFFSGGGSGDGGGGGGGCGGGCGGGGCGG